MTDLDTHAGHPHRLRVAVRTVRRVLPKSGCGLPAPLLIDPLVSAWVRTHGVTVHVGDAAELGLVRAGGVPADQVLWRCGPSAVAISGALACGVTRFVASTRRHLTVLSELAAGAASVHLDPDCLLATGPPAGVEVVGVHGAVVSAEPDAWAVSAHRLLGHLAGLRRDGVEVTRMSLAGGSAATWLRADKHQLMAMASAVDEAIDDGCARWRVPRPTVMLGPIGM
ncbi:hypothetical protein ACTJJE_22310 [Mycolicibacterium sp. 22603]|uniref:hypothetical protein n=1 Tax=Mycolicibacterium sp. 22603 TaxID=3453950 RepID=UPI003F87DBFF